MADSIFSTEPLPAGTRIACRIEYNGSRYSGWQSQSHEGVVTVQDELEAALAQIATTAIRVQCAGRTDTGVHAHTQVIHFDAPIARSPKAWVIGGNAHLPQDIRIHWAVAVDPEFHALGVPMFVQTTAPGLGGQWSGLLISQDTGGAIKGPVRGDIYFGTGHDAGNRAGTMNAPGRLWVLLPRAVAERMFAAGLVADLPVSGHAGG